MAKGAGSSPPQRAGSPAARGLGLVLVVAALAGGGCTRHFFRERADCAVGSVLRQKDQYQQWKIQDANVYPDPRARFADPTNPDRPPMPPDDPAAEILSPNPQKPGKAGVAYIEGHRYLDILKEWNDRNRVEDAVQEGQQEEASSATVASKDGSTGQGNELCPAPQPFRLRLEQAAELGLINSREYQTERENLYLAALPVTLERFAFAPHFFAIEQAIREWTGRETPAGQHNRWNLNTNVGFTKEFATGALLMFGIANQTLIELSGSPSPRTVSESTLTLDLMQPLLRGGGQAVTLEPLTESERNLLYQIRTYAHFRKGFFVAVTGGGAVSVTPLVPVTTPQGTLTSATVSTGVSTTGGYLPTLEFGAVTANDQANVRALEGFLKLFQAFKEGGDVSQLQVDQVEQQLLQGRSTVLQDEVNYGNSLDALRLQLGLPENVLLELDDAPVRPLMQQFQKYLNVFARYDAARDEAAAPGPPERSAELRQRLRRIFSSTRLVRGLNFPERLARRWAGWEELTDMQLEVLLRQLAAERRRLLDQRADLEQSGKKLDGNSAERLAELDFEIDLGSFERTLREYEHEPWKAQPNPDRRTHQRAVRFQNAINDFMLVLGEARSERLRQLRQSWPELPRVCVAGVDLLQAEDLHAEATVAQSALVNRLDLMNARAQLVDAWRQIAVAANALLGVLNLEYRLTSFTPFGQAKPLAFGGSRNENQIIINGQLPLVRVAERNTYRATLIAYQRQRRILMDSEDRAVTAVRAELRLLRGLAEDYKIQQRQVELAYATVESSLDTFRAPPAPPQAGAATNTAVSAASLTQQLLSAQSSLPRAQNGLIAVWIQFLIARLELYRDLDMMQIDSRGVWLDELSTCERPEARRPDSRSSSASSGERSPRLGSDSDRLESLPPPSPLPAAGPPPS